MLLRQIMSLADITVEVKQSQTLGVNIVRRARSDPALEFVVRVLPAFGINQLPRSLAHHPRTFEEASKLGVDLQLSGHTHGGQMWPFGFLVKLQTPSIAGLYERDGSRLYVSQGTGFWGPPMRILAPAEITEIVLHAEQV